MHSAATGAVHRVLWTDDDGDPWFESDDAAVEVETEKLNASTGTYLRVVRLRPGAVPSDVAHAPERETVLVMEPGHSARVYHAAVLYQLRARAPTTPAVGRLALGRDAVLSPTAAAKLLPRREADSLRWLHQSGCVREVPGFGQAVVWGDVLSAIATPGASPARPALRSNAIRPREKL